MDLQKTLTKAIVSLILGCSVVAAAYEIWVHSWGNNYSSNPSVPKDQELITIFHLHRNAFDKLQQMAAEDAQHGWYLGFSDLHRLEKSRQQEYERLLSEIRQNLDATMDNHWLRFIFAHHGIAIGPGWVKGIEYVPTNYVKAGILQTNLDAVGTLPANIYLREIETNWFIFYQRDD
jgi:hypothetical protein